MQRYQNTHISTEDVEEESEAERPRETEITDMQN